MLAVCRVEIMVAETSGPKAAYQRPVVCECGISATGMRGVFLAPCWSRDLTRIRGFLYRLDVWKQRILRAGLGGDALQVDWRWW